MSRYTHHFLRLMRWTCLAMFITWFVPGHAFAQTPYEGASPDMTRAALGGGFVLAGATSMVLGYRYGLRNQAQVQADEVDQLTAQANAGRADILLFGGALASVMGASLVIYEFTKKPKSLAHMRHSKVSRVRVVTFAQGIQLNISFR